MRTFARSILSGFLLGILVVPALAAGTEVDLPSGKTVMLMHPGVDGVVAPQVVRSRLVAPAYPERAGRITGGSTVTIAVMILADGSLGQLEVLGASHPNLGYEESAKNAVSRWAFRPARLNGEPVASYQIYAIEFPDRLTTLDRGHSLEIERLFDPTRTFFATTGPVSGSIAGMSGGTTTPLAMGNGTRVGIAPIPPYATGQLTDQTNSGRYIGTTDWAAQER